jgi:hypothetical protein
MVRIRSNNGEKNFILRIMRSGRGEASQVSPSPLDFCRKIKVKKDIYIYKLSVLKFVKIRS